MKNPLIRTLALAAFPCLSSFALAQTVYSNDFETSDLSGWSAGSIASTSGGSHGATQYLLMSGPGVYTLSLTGLPADGTATLTFDLFVLNTMDGESTSYGKDYFRLLPTGGGYLIDATFANEGYGQSYSAATQLGGGALASRTDADESDSLGFESTVYKFGGAVNPSFTFAYTGTSLSIDFVSAATQGWSDEGFGVDNVNVSVQAVPEPASLAALSLGALALLKRRKKA